MTNKMALTYTCCGMAGKTTEITPPDINKLCPECNNPMNLIDGRGFSNSGTHTFVAECTKCQHKEKFSDYELWKECLEIERNG